VVAVAGVSERSPPLIVDASGVDRDRFEADEMDRCVGATREDALSEVAAS